MKSDVRSMAGLDRMLGSQVLIRVSLGSTLFESVGEVVRRTARLAFASLGVNCTPEQVGSPFSCNFRCAAFVLETCDSCDFLGFGDNKISKLQNLLDLK